MRRNALWVCSSVLLGSLGVLVALWVGVFVSTGWLRVYLGLLSVLPGVVVIFSLAAVTDISLMTDEEYSEQQNRFP